MSGDNTGSDAVTDAVRAEFGTTASSVFRERAKERGTHVILTLASIVQALALETAAQ